MKIKVFIYKITDSLGEISWGVVDDSSENIQLSGKRKNGTLQLFECEAYHVASWAEENNFKFELIEKEITI